MKFNWKLSKHKNLLLKVAAASLILGLAFRFFFFGSSQIKTPIADATVVEGPPSLPASVHVQYNGSILIPDNEDQIPQGIFIPLHCFHGRIESPYAKITIWDLCFIAVFRFEITGFI